MVWTLDQMFRRLYSKTPTVRFQRWPVEANQDEAVKHLNRLKIDSFKAHNSLEDALLGSKVDDLSDASFQKLIGGLIWLCNHLKKMIIAKHSFRSICKSLYRMQSLPRFE